MDKYSCHPKEKQNARSSPSYRPALYSSSFEFSPVSLAKSN